MLAPALAEILRSQRDAFNARFATARRQWPHLEPTDFSLFLRDQLSPLIAAVSATTPDRAFLVTQTAYTLGLQLVAEKRTGPAARHPALNRLWSELFPALAPLIAADPRRIIASLSNAAHQLATTPPARVDDWHAQLATLGPRCADSTQLLVLAQLLSWRAGLAHYRTSALNAAAALPPDLALAAVGAPAHASWPDVQSAHLANPWHGYTLNKNSSSSTPGSAGGPPASASVASPSASSHPFRRIGAFRGFGGLFLTPPLVTTTGDLLLVRSGDEAWLLIADLHGATLHRASPSELAASIPPAAVPPIDFKPPASFASVHTLSSHTIAGTTAAFTSAQSHTVWVGPATAASR